MKRKLLRFFEAIALPFISVAVMIDESKRINEDGSWDKYHARRNKRLMKKAERKANK